MLASVRNAGKIIQAFKFDSSVINKRDKSGMTPIYYAASLKRWENVIPIAETGGDINFADTAGKTP
jgi:hypothetical protein